MSRPWKKGEAAESQAGKGGWVNGAVLIALIVAVAVVAAMVMVPPEQWQSLRRNLPARWEALRALLRGERPGREELLPLASPTPPSPTPAVTEEQPLRY